VTSLGDPGSSAADIDPFLADLRQSRRQRAAQPIRIPREQIAKRIREGEARGPQLSPALLSSLGKLADQLGLPPLQS
jgi:LDH2 family malate/lactate/ureidoglycolate dehydrogenase